MKGELELDRETLQAKSLADLREISKLAGLKSITKYRKSELIEMLLGNMSAPADETEALEALQKEAEIEQEAAGEEPPAEQKPLHASRPRQAHIGSQKAAQDGAEGMPGADNYRKPAYVAPGYQARPQVETPYQQRRQYSTFSQGGDTAYQPRRQPSGYQGSYQRRTYNNNFQQQQGYQQQGYQQRQEREYEPDGDPKTLSTGAITMFSYSGILFFIPLVAAKHSRFARFHASQGLNILLAGIAYSIASGLLSFLFGLISWQLALVMGTVFGIGSIALFVLVILGVVNVCKGEMKPLPVIGKFQIIKM